MVLRRSVDITLHTLLAAMSRARCGEPHQIFAGGLRYIPPSSAKQLDRAAFEELGELGLTRGNELNGAFEDTLHALDHPDIEYYAHVRTGNAQCGALVAVRGRNAVIALCQDDRARLTGVPEYDRPAALVAKLPDFAPAYFTPFSFPQNKLDHDDSGLYDVPAARSPEARQLQEIFDQPQYGLGYFYAARRTGDGHRLEAQDSLTYLDIDAGRVGIEVTGTPGNRYVTVFPGDPSLLARKLTGLSASLND